MPYQGMMNHLSAKINDFAMGPHTHIAQTSTQVFDVIVWQMISALLVGGKVTIFDEDEAWQPDLLLARLQQTQVNIVESVPSHLNILLDYLQQHPQPLPHLQHFMMNGEALPLRSYQQWQQLYPEICMSNLYGPTECSDDVTHYIPQAAEVCPESRILTIGWAIQNTKLYILDRHLQPVPVGVLGELYISGPGVSNGYLNQAQLTAERFLRNPFASAQDIDNGYGSLYKTADIVKYRADGQIDFVGRDDFQVKISGQRIELGEIEHALMALPSIQQACVKLQQGHHKALVAYVVFQQDAPESVEHYDPEQIRQQLAKQLPEALLPKGILALSEMPLTINGKLDRQALPEVTLAAQQDYVAPQSTLEKYMCQLWQSLLGQDKVGIDDDFFRIGGDSIISIQFSSRLRQLGYHLSIRDIFEYRKIATLAKHAQPVHQTSDAAQLPAEQGALHGQFDLLPIQRWFFAQEMANKHHWNQSFLIHTPSLARQRLQAIVPQLLAYHDILRLHFIEQDGQPLQAYRQEIACPEVHYLDVSEASPAQIEACYSQWQSQFDIYQGPLWSIGYVDGFADGSARIYLAAHHLIMDTVTWRILIQDLNRLYHGEALPAKGHSYRQWVQAIAKQNLTAAEQAYWQSQQQAMRPYPRPSPLPAAQKLAFSLPASETSQLLNLCGAAYHTKINDLLLTALAYALQAWHQQGSSFITLEGHGREMAAIDLDVAHTAGWFTTMYPVAIHVGRDLRQSIQLTKESLAQVPRNGIGYALYQDPSAENAAYAALPPVRFNYLGRFITEGASDWRLSADASGQALHAGYQDDLLLDIGGAVVNQQLQMHVKGRLPQDALQQIQQAFEIALRRIIDHTASMQRSYHTPSDFPSVTLSQAQLDQLQADRYGMIAAIYPANHLQSGFIYTHLKQLSQPQAPQVQAYQLQSIWDYRCAIDAAHLQQAWQFAVQKHPILRSAFHWDEALIQVIYQQLPLPWSQQDISQMADAAGYIEQLSAQSYAQAYDLQQPGLFTLQLFKLDQQHYRFVLNMHHIIIDGWGLQMLLADVHAFYQQLEQGAAVTIEEDRAYLQAQKYLLDRQQQALDYWLPKKEALQPRDDISLLMDKACVATPAKVPMQTGEVLLQCPLAPLKALAQAQGITLNVLLQFAWQKLIQLYSGSQQTIVGTTLSGRSLEVEGIERAVGLFINTLPLAIDWSQQQPIAQQLQQIHQQITDINTHHHVPLNRLQSGGRRLFNVLIAFENFPKMQAASTALSIEKGPFKLAIDYPLGLSVSEKEEHLSLRLRFAEDYFSAARAESLLSQLIDILYQLPHVLSQPHSAIHLPAAAPTTMAPLEEAPSVLSRVLQHAQQHSERIAVSDDQQQLSYGQLAQQMYNMRCFLQQSELPESAIVMVYGPRCAAAVVSFLGIMAAGAAYLPMDSKQPIARVQQICQQSGCRHIIDLSDQSLQQLPQLSKMQFIDYPQAIQNSKAVKDEEASAAEQAGAPQWLPSKATLAYLIYTSGSSGQPKGVQVSHQALAYYSQSICQRLPASLDSFAWISTMSADLGNTAIYGALYQGACLQVIPEELAFDANALAAYLHNHPVDCLKIVPSHLQALLSASDPKAILPQKCLVVGGEAFSWTLLSQIQDLAPELAVYNHYGPTEACVGALVADAKAQQADQACYRSVPIGQPLPSVQCYILDEQQRPVPPLMTGELYLAGPQLAAGYQGAPDLSAQQFVSLTEGSLTDGTLTLDGPALRLYRTGDRVRMSAHGQIEFIGRADDQIKIRGYRVELSEIAQVLSGHFDVADAVLIAQPGPSNTTQLLAFWVAGDFAPSEQELKAYCQQKLPSHMQPDQFIQIDALPLTANGKVDKSALPLPGSSCLDARPITAPANAIEQCIHQAMQQLLNVSPISTDDDFFKLGGDSIMSIQLVSRLYQQGYQCTVHDIFEYRSIRALAQQIVQQQTTPLDAEQGQLAGSFDLLPIQHWFFAQAFAQPHHFNQSFWIQVPALEISRLNAILPQLIAQHDVLRLSFGQQNGKWQQCYHAQIPAVSVSHLNLQGLSDSQCQQAFTDLQSQFALTQAPLWQIAYVDGFADGQQRILLSLHHLIVDAVSWRILCDDLCRLYHGKPLGQKTSSYRQWVDFIAQYPQQYDEAEYWQQLIAAQQAYPVAEQALSVHQISLSAPQTQQLLTRCQQAYHSEINDLLLTALVYALDHWQPQASHWITLEGHGREAQLNQMDLSRTLGWFTTKFPVRLCKMGQLAETIKGVKTALHSIPNKGVGYGAFKYSAQATPELQQHVLPAVMFNYLGQFTEDSESQQWQLSTQESGQWSHEQNQRHLLLNMNCAVTAGQLTLTLHARTDASQAAAMMQHFQHMLQQIIDHTLAQPYAQFTPTDFPTVILSQSLLDNLQQQQPIADIYPAGSLQQGFIYHHLLHPQDCAYRSQKVWTYRSPIQPQILQAAWQHMLAIHPILRTAFDWQEALIQVVYPSAPLPWQEVDLTLHPDPQACIAQYQAEDRTQEYDFKQPCLLRLTLFKLADAHFVLLFSGHHIILDGWSSALLFNQVHETYCHIRDQQPLRDQPDDTYLQALQHRHRHQAQAQQYWQQQPLQAFTANDLRPMMDRSVCTMPQGSIAQPQQINHQLSQAQTQQLQAVAQSVGVTMNVLMQFAWHKLIACYSGDDVTVVGVTVAGRDPSIANIEQSIGVYINTLPLRVEWPAQAEVREVLQQIHRSITDINRYNNISLSQLQTGTKRLFHSLFAFENFPVEDCQVSPELQIVVERSEITLDYPLGIAIHAGDQQIAIRLRYAGECFSSQRIELLITQYQAILAAMVTDTAASHQQIELSPAREQTASLAQTAATEHAASKQPPSASSPAPAARAGMQMALKQLEYKVADIWQTLLERSDIDRQQNFFDMGGNSLLVIHLKSTFDRQLPWAEIKITDIFTYPTLAAFVAYLTPKYKQHLAQQESLQSAAGAVVTPPSAEQPVLSEQLAQAASLPTEDNDGVAIIGCSGAFPGAENVEAFWQNILQGEESIDFLDKEALLALGIAEHLIDKPNYVPARGRVENIADFDPLFWHMSPQDASLMDPQIRKFIEHSWLALEQAGYIQARRQQRIGVFAGCSDSQYWSDHIATDPHIAETVSAWQIHKANDKDFLATRASYLLGLTGPSLNINTACSTSLVAISEACDKLRQGRCDLALAGGVSLSLPHQHGYHYKV